MVRERKIIQPEVPELQPDPFENVPGYLQCTKCLKWKDKATQFYSHSKTGFLVNKKCRTCNRERINKQNEGKIDEHKIAVGSEDVRKNPGEYSDIYQQNYIESFLTLCGWKKNNDGIWWKEPFKDETGKWLLTDEDNVWRNGHKIDSKIIRNKDIIIKLRGEGKTYKEIGEITGVKLQNIAYYIRKWNLEELKSQTNI